MRRHVATLLYTMLLCGTACSGASGVVDLPQRPPHESDVPDLTGKGGPDPETAAKDDWFLHCGGCRGWVYRDAAGKCDRARQPSTRLICLRT